jgi:phosphatidylglycerophosphate synthase
MYAKDNLIFASLALIISSIFDVADGAVARLNKQVSAFGGFFDSLSDRYSDAAVLIGIALYLEDHYLLVFVVLIGSYLVSYSRARAEMEIKKCDVGIGERAERLVILIVATIIQASNIFRSNAIYWALIVLALITHFTVLQRIWYTYRVLEK